LKKVIYFLSFTACLQYATAQPPAFDTSGTLKEQQEKIITASTIVKIENLGPTINTQYPELRPTISADGNLLFFIVENHPSNTNYRNIRNSQDIWYAFRDEDGKWGKAYHLGYPLNTYYYNAVFWISPDNNRILVRNAFINGDYVGNGVSMSQLRRDGTWSKPEMLKIKNYLK